jgi:hypothetical protein
MRDRKHPVSRAQVHPLFDSDSDPDFDSDYLNPDP